MTIQNPVPTLVVGKPVRTFHPYQKTGSVIGVLVSLDRDQARVLWNGREFSVCARYVHPT